MTDLEPCPFCGETETLLRNPASAGEYVNCTKCQTFGPHHANGMHWNNRAKPAPDLAAALIEAERALALARNRLQACAVYSTIGTREALDASDWAKEAAAALAKCRQITGGE